MNNVLRAMLLSVLIFFSSGPIYLEAGPFYVVIGTFSEQASARKFATSIKELFSEASSRHDSARNLYYVHVMETNLQREAEDFRHHLQRKNGFVDAWIFTDLASGENPAYGRMNSSQDYTKLELYTGGAILLSSGDNSNLSITTHQAEMKGNTGKPSGKTLTFIAVTPTGTTTPARVLLMSHNGSEISAFKTGEVVAFSGKQGAQMLTLVCQVPGFSTETKMVDLGNLSNVRDISQNSDGVWEVRFPLARLKINEINLLYHRVFYPEAAVLEPAAKKQVDVLLSLVKSNPKWRIEINVHCNPGEKRNIMLPGKGKSYFDISEAIEKSGSDKHLTKERAETLKDYLVDHGIDSKRITVLGWGSLDLLVKGGGENAVINERVEVELVAGS